MRFSERIGVVPVKNIIQIDSMNAELRNGLWNVLSLSYLSTLKGSGIASDYRKHAFVKALWLDFFKSSIDSLDDWGTHTYEAIRNYFFKCPWYSVYELIEFVAERYPLNQAHNNSEKFIQDCNNILARELAGYRFIGTRLAPITSQEEISEIDEALHAQGPIAIHLKAALDLLADKKNPDYRNSIKESISAVESLCKNISGNDKATLGEALKIIEKKIPLHPSLKEAFNKLYGYTSNAQGIRHALMEDANLKFEDAKFMLVTCSAFTNYLQQKMTQ